MIETLQRFAEPIVMYPFSSGAHVLIMALAGWLLVRSHAHGGGGVMVRTFSIMLVSLWCLYEVAEFAQLKDNVSGDLAIGIIGFIGGAFLKAWIHVHKHGFSKK